MLVKLIRKIKTRLKLYRNKIISSELRYKPLTKKNFIVSEGAYIEDSAIIKIKGDGKVIIGSNTEVLDGVILMSYFSGCITIGSNCSINPYTIIYGVADTIIGNNVLIAGHCMIIPNNHIFSDKSRPINSQGNNYKGIIIEDDVWIGHGCSILDGVTISKGAVIAAGSVVNKSVPPFCVYGGNPAKLIKQR